MKAALAVITLVLIAVAVGMFSFGEEDSGWVPLVAAVGVAFVMSFFKGKK